MEYGERYYFIYHDGDVYSTTWINSEMDNGAYNQNNVFKTRKEAELESKRRALVAKIQRFRDESNSGKQFNWEDISQKKYFICYDSWIDDLCVSKSHMINNLVVFGYFLDEYDAETAKNLFGSEIKKLFIEVEE